MVTWKPRVPDAESATAGEASKLAVRPCGGVSASARLPRGARWDSRRLIGHECVELVWVLVLKLQGGSRSFCTRKPGARSTAGLSWAGPELGVLCFCGATAHATLRTLNFSREELSFGLDDDVCKRPSPPGGHRRALHFLPTRLQFCFRRQGLDPSGASVSGMSGALYYCC